MWFYKLKHDDAELLKTRTITIEELGFRDALAMEVNPHNGYCLSNFSCLAAMWHQKSARVKYVFDKLKGVGLIYFEISQGQKESVPFFVLGFEMKKEQKGTLPRIVTPEYIEKITAFSEVSAHFQKLKPFRSIDKPSSLPPVVSEVAQIEKEIQKEKQIEIEKEKEKQIYKHPLFKNLSMSFFSHLREEYTDLWLEIRLGEYARRYPSQAMSEDRLQGLLKEDTVLFKPPKKQAHVWEGGASHVLKEAFRGAGNG